MRYLLSVVAALVLFLTGVTAAWAGDKSEKRIAFVVGNESYADGALPTAANDAGLIAQTLQAAGFDVIGARDLDAETLRQSYADFLKKVTGAGPDTVAFIYLAGYGLQYGNDNYYVPIGATVSRGADIPIETVRLSDLTGPLIALNLKARFLVFDAAYKVPFKIDGPPLAGGFSLVDASPGSLIAYNAAPGTVAPVAKENYGLYARSLAAMLREGGLPPDEIFDRVRLRVNDQSKGAEVPWDTSKIDTDVRFFDRGKDAPPPAATAEQTAALIDKPLKDLPVKQAYTAAVARDTVESYSQFTTLYGGDPLAKRARVLLAARREAITWRRTISVDTPPAYWSYLSRYPRGPHADDARLRLQELAAAEAPPPDYPALAYDVPPPPPDEDAYVDQPVIYFDDPEFADYDPPPPPPDYWLPPVPVAFIDLPPPPPPFGLFFLPVPAFVPLPAYYDPPPYVVYPQDDYFYGGYADGVPYDRRIDVNNIHRPFPAGGPHEGGPGGPGGPGLHGAVIGAALGAAAVALPAAAMMRTNALQRRGITTPQQLRAARSAPGGLTDLIRPGHTGPALERNALPGAGGHQLPKLDNGRPAPSASGARAAAPGHANEAVRRGGPDKTRSAGPETGGREVPNERNRTRAHPSGPAERGREAVQAAHQNAHERRTAAQQRAPAQRGRGQQRIEQRHEVAPRVQAPRAQAPRFQAPRAQAPRPQIERAVPRAAAPPRQAFRPPPQARPGGFGGGGPRPGGFGGGAHPRGGGGPPHPGGGGGGRPHL